MKPTAVLVETNWLVDVVAPAHLQSPQAIQLLARAESGEFKLYIPARCFAEARETVPRRFSPRSRSEDLRKFVRWARDSERVMVEDAQAAFRVFDQFDGLVAHELTRVPERLDELVHNPSIHVFSLSEAMLDRQVSVGAMDFSPQPALKPYDLTILAAILVKSELLLQEGHSWVGFCELDSDLQPWDRTGAQKQGLASLYNAAQVSVYADFFVEEVNERLLPWMTQT